MYGLVYIKTWLLIHLLTCFTCFAKRVCVFVQKERDLELAARIGQSLLKKNKALSERNELLEEQVDHIREEVHNRCVRLSALQYLVVDNV